MLVDHINRILSSTESARFAVGYFFLSGLESIAQRLAGVKELRLLHVEKGRVCGQTHSSQRSGPDYYTI